ncbi:hypothetical protein ACFGZ0_06355 [Pasteurella multocida]|nr:hypothetical protein [Pasteurella multocida]MDY0577878.1 hypothetical protein [Pasteurella multocida]MEB3472711.1 hypothetical protein [Pasteurella multocida]MEB3486745.1 hypothetical protein [Pasteurella multocida]MEB3497434.1 hypothetical protein [Pasteurella multocida]MEB3502002.1 hypothetical protein [Pasteurella multocida]
MPLQNSFIKRYPEFEDADPEQVGILLKMQKLKSAKSIGGDCMSVA